MGEINFYGNDPVASANGDVTHFCCKARTEDGKLVINIIGPNLFIVDVVDRSRKFNQ
ncbi:hypothetical protein [uncultured Methanobacterium sp.]|uniref:hypothetical protein n=1 Tax=uncultured Methanobacterium sp. TaxID=176306 RepID=UPI002AA72607|nr:hypothetical protein [uncultured Methanobacterium sp.]